MELKKIDELKKWLMEQDSIEGKQLEVDDQGNWKIINEESSNCELEKTFELFDTQYFWDLINLYEFPKKQAVEIFLHDLLITLEIRRRKQ